MIVHLCLAKLKKEWYGSNMTRLRDYVSFCPAVTFCWGNKCDLWKVLHPFDILDKELIHYIRKGEIKWETI